MNVRVHYFPDRGRSRIYHGDARQFDTLEDGTPLWEVEFPDGTIIHVSVDAEDDDA